MKTGIELISAERERQITQEGWTPEHDDRHDIGELCSAANAYLFAGDCLANAERFNPKYKVTAQSLTQEILENEKLVSWPWDEDSAQVWLYADSDEAGRNWLEEEQGFAWHLRRRCRALHAHVCEGSGPDGRNKDFNDLHRAACEVDREQWSAELREALRNQWQRGQRRRRYRPGKRSNPKK